MPGLDVGQKALPFELPGDDGAAVRLADFQGRIVVLYFYPKDDTTGCTAEAIAFSGLMPDFAKAGAAVVGVSPDSVKKHGKFKAKHDLRVILVADESRALIEGYGLWVEKSMYGRKYMGVERTTILIDREGKVARVWPKVSVPDHAQEVLEAVRQLAG